MKKLIALFIILLIITFFIGLYLLVTEKNNHNEIESPEWVTIDTLHIQDTVIWVGNDESRRKSNVYLYYPETYRTITIRLIKK